MQARELRTKYFEQYVIFEHFIRRVVRIKIESYKTQNKSMNKIIEDLSSANTRANSKLPIKLIKLHHKIRN